MAVRVNEVGSAWVVDDVVSLGPQQHATGLPGHPQGGVARRTSSRTQTGEGRLRPWFAARDLAEVRELFTGAGVSWGPYQTFRQLVTEDPRCSTANPMFAEVDQPGIGTYLAPRSSLDLDELNPPVVPAPVLGQHTEEVLERPAGSDGS